MKTIKEMREALKEYFDDEEVKVNVIIQNEKSLRSDNTVTKMVLPLNYACVLFGEYEMLWNMMNTYTKKIESSLTTYETYEAPCIDCGIYIPLE